MSRTFKFWSIVTWAFGTSVASRAHENLPKDFPCRLAVPWVRWPRTTALFLSVTQRSLSF